MFTKYKKTIIFLSLLSLLLVPIIAWGANSQFIPDACLNDKAKDCGLRELVQMFANFYSFFLKYLGALALLLFVVGGITFMTSGGNQEQISRAKQILVGTTIGLLIVMVSYLAINQIQEMIGVQPEYQIQQKDNKK